MQPFASNDTYICPDCGAEVRVGARRCPGCGPFRPLSQTGGEEFEPYANSNDWQDDEPGVRMDCLLPLPYETEDGDPGKTRKTHFVTWWMAILIALTLLAGLAAALRFL